MGKVSRKLERRREIMAMACIYGGACDGCMSCGGQPIAECEVCGGDIYEGDEVYEYNGFLIEEGCLKDNFKLEVCELPGGCVCEACAEEINEGDYTYNLNGEIVHEDCLEEYFSGMKCTAELYV